MSVMEVELSDLINVRSVSKPPINPKEDPILYDESGWDVEQSAVVNPETNNRTAGLGFFLAAAKEGNKQAIDLLVAFYLKSDKPEIAEKILMDAIYSGQIEYFVNLGNVLAHQFKIEDAKKCYEKAMKMGFVKAIRPLVKLLNHEGNVDEAKRICTEAGNEHEANLAMGEMLYTNGDLDKAIPYYEKAYALGNYGAFTKLIALLCFKDKLEQAEAICQNAMALRDSRAFVLSALIHAKRGFAASKEFRLAVEHNKILKDAMSMASEKKKQGDEKGAQLLIYKTLMSAAQISSELMDYFNGIEPSITSQHE